MAPFWILLIVELSYHLSVCSTSAFFRDMQRLLRLSFFADNLSAWPINNHFIHLKKDCNQNFHRFNVQVFRFPIVAFLVCHVTAFLVWIQPRGLCDVSCFFWLKFRARYCVKPDFGHFWGKGKFQWYIDCLDHADYFDIDETGLINDYGT